jgi:hypothetical protein
MHLALTKCERLSRGIGRLPTTIGVGLFLASVIGCGRKMDVDGKEADSTIAVLVGPSVSQTKLVGTTLLDADPVLGKPRPEFRAYPSFAWSAW